MNSRLCIWRDCGRGWRKVAHHLCYLTLRKCRQNKTKKIRNVQNSSEKGKTVFPWNPAKCRVNMKNLDITYTIYKTTGKAQWQNVGSFSLWQRAPHEAWNVTLKMFMISKLMSPKGRNRRLTVALALPWTTEEWITFSPRSKMDGYWWNLGQGGCNPCHEFPLLGRKWADQEGS